MNHSVIDRGDGALTMADAHTWQDLTIPGLFVRAAQRWHDRLALVTPYQSYTYEELLQRVQGMVHGLRAQGVEPGDQVATLFGTRGEWVILHYAAAFLGAILVPLNTRFRAEEIRCALKQVQATVLVTMDRDGSQDLLARVMEACPGLDKAHQGQIEDRSLPDLRLVICHSSEGHAAKGCLEWSSVQVERDLPIHCSASVSPEDVAIILFTTGSTGQPKAAMLSHRNLIGHAHFLSKLLKIQPGDRYLNILPFFHIAGYAQSILLNHYAGSTLYLVDSFKPDEIVRAISEHRITAWAGMPITVQRVLDQARDAGGDLTSLQKQHGVSPELWDRVLRETKTTILTRMYGLTESAGLVSMSRPGEQDPNRGRDNVGKPLPGVAVRIVDPQTQREMAQGQVGEIVFKGWNCFKGYYGDPQGTADTIDREGYCHTGDQGFVDTDSFLHFLGRYKEIVKTGGENVSALEVEQFLCQHIPAIKSVCVVGVADAAWGEAVTAVIEPEAGTNVNPESVRVACAGRIASFKVPRHVLLISSDDWPLTGSGKVDRRKLSDWAAKQLSLQNGKRG